MENLTQQSSMNTDVRESINNSSCIEAVLCVIAQLNWLIHW